MTDKREIQFSIDLIDQNQALDSQNDGLCRKIEHAEKAKNCRR